MDETVIDVTFVLIGFALLMFGGEALVQGATRISQSLSISPLVCLLYTSPSPRDRG